MTAAVIIASSATCASIAFGEAGDGGDETVVNLYAFPVDRHPRMARATMFKMLSFSGRDGAVATKYEATIRLGVERRGRPARTLVLKHVAGHTDGNTPFALRLDVEERAMLRRAADSAHRRTVMAEIQPTPKGPSSSSGRRIGERRAWLILVR